MILCGSSIYQFFRGVIFLICLILSLPSLAQTFSFSRLSQADGLPGNNAQCFLKDQSGFMWIGTSAGLCRYDGHEIKPYTQDLGYDISDDHINSLIQDTEGLIWIGTNGGGINRFNPKTEAFTSFRHDPENPKTIAGDRVRMLADGDSILWVAFDNGRGLSKFNKQTEESINYDPFLSITVPGVKAIRGMVLDRYNPNVLWLGTTSGLIRFNIKSETFDVIEHPLTSQNRHGLFALEQIDENRLIAGLFHAGIDIYDIDQQKWKGVYTNPDMEVRIFGLSKKSKNEYWVAARKRGLAIYNLVKDELSFVASDINHQKTPFPGFTYTVYTAGEQVWVGSKHGVSYSNIEKSPFDFTPIEFSSAEFGTITHIEGRYNKIYMAGLSLPRILEIDKITREVKSYPLPNEIVSLRGMLELEDRIYLVNNKNDFFLFDKTSRRCSPLEIFDLNKEKIVICDLKWWTKNTAIILTRFGGAWELDLETHKASGIEKLSSIDEWQQDLLVHPNGELWLGTDRGITIYDSEKSSIKKLGLKVIQSRNEKHVHSITLDRKGVVWIGTARGLIRLDGEKETLFNVLNSDLPGNIITDIAFDGEDNLWLSTQKGISKINTTTMSFVNYDISDGLTLSGILKEINGELFYGTYGGFFVLTDQKVFPDETSLDVHLTSFQVANLDFPLEKMVDFVDEINLNYWENSFSFSFTSPSYHPQSKIQYAYQLVGQDKDWVHTTDRRFATYTNLDGGSYLFNVKARTREGEWGAVKSITINLATPYWKTWWFHSLGVLLVVSTIFLSYKVRVRVLQRRADLEAQELRFEALQKRLQELNATPPEINLDIKDLNDKLNTPLSDREFEVLKLSLDGKTNSEIAEELFISNSTVKFHLRNTYGKLGVNNRKEALEYVVKTP